MESKESPPPPRTTKPGTAAMRPQIVGAVGPIGCQVGFEVSGGSSHIPAVTISRILSPGPDMVSVNPVKNSSMNNPMIMIGDEVVAVNDAWCIGEYPITHPIDPSFEDTRTHNSLPLSLSLPPSPSLSLPNISIYVSIHLCLQLMGNVSPSGLTDAEVSQKLLDGEPGSTLRVRLERNEHGMTSQFEAIIRRRPQIETEQVRQLLPQIAKPAENAAATGLGQFVQDGGASPKSLSIHGLGSKVNGIVTIDAAAATALDAVPSKGGGMKISAAPRALDPKSTASAQAEGQPRTEFGSLKGGAIQQLHKISSDKSLPEQLTASHRSESLQRLSKQDVKATYRILCAFRFFPF